MEAGKEKQRAIERYFIVDGEGEIHLRMSAVYGEHTI